MKFSVKSIYPISTSSQATKCPGSWEFAAAEVEYSFMGKNSQHQGQSTKGNYDFKYPNINLQDYPVSVKLSVFRPEI